MTNKNDGGPAFPVRPNDREAMCADQGMSLRDYFAAAALQGLAANQETLLGNKELIEEFGTIGIDKLQANKAYRLADAMIAEREK